MKLSPANNLRILYFLAFCCQAAWAPILADYLQQQGITGLRASVLLNIVPVMFFLVQPLTGMLTDRIGYKKSLLAACAGAAVCFMAYALQGGFGYLFFITVFMALHYNTVQPVLDSIALNLSEKNTGFSYGSLRIAGAAGWSFMGILNGYLVDGLSIQVIFILSAISIAFTFVFALFLNNSTHTVEQQPPVSAKALFTLLNNKQLLFILTAIFLVSVGATAIWNFYSVYMKENGASAKLVGYGLSFQGLCELPLFFFSAIIIKKIGLRSTLVLTVMVTAIRLMLYSIVTNPQWAIAIELLHGISWSLFWVACVELADSLVDTQKRATGQSLLYASYFGTGAIVGNFWTGYLQETNLTIAQVFLLNAGIVAVTGLCMALFFYKVKPQVTATGEGIV